MKKIVILISTAFMFLNSAMSQSETLSEKEKRKAEERKEMRDKYSFNFMCGLNTMINYPTISMFQSNVSSYTNMHIDQMVIRECSDNFALELVLSVGNVDIPHTGTDIMSEKFFYNSGALGARIKYPISEKFTIYQSFRFGVLYARNQWKSSVDNLTKNERRYGMNMTCFTGVEYAIKENLSLNFGIGFPAMGMVSKSLKDDKFSGMFDGFTIMMGWQF